MRKGCVLVEILDAEEFGDDTVRSEILFIYSWATFEVQQILETLQLHELMLNMSI